MDPSSSASSSHSPESSSGSTGSLSAEKQISLIYSRILLDRADNGEPLPTMTIVPLLHEAETLASTINEESDLSKYHVLNNLKKLEPDPENGCKRISLSWRYYTTQSLATKFNVSGYIHEMNGRQYEICRQFLETELAKLVQTIPENALGEMVKLRNMVKESMDAGIAEPVPIYKRFPYIHLARACIKYLDSLSVERLEWLLDDVNEQQSLHEFVAHHYEPLLDHYIMVNCRPFISELSELYFEIFMFLTDRPDVIERMNEQNIGLMESTSICLQLRFDGGTSYILGSYDLYELSDTLFSPNSGPSDPEQTLRNLKIINQIIMARQAQMQENHADLKNQVDRFLNVGLIGPEKCHKHNFDYLNELKRNDARANNHLLTYLEHYGQLQLAICADLLNSFIRDFVSERGRDSGFHIDGLRRALEWKIHDGRLDGDVKLHRDPIPQELFTNALMAYTRARGLDLVALVRDMDQVDNQINQIELIQTLGRTCEFILRELSATKDYFDSLLQWDEAESFFERLTFDWMSNVNICRFISAN